MQISMSLKDTCQLGLHPEDILEIILENCHSRKIRKLLECDCKELLIKYNKQLGNEPEEWRVNLYKTMREEECELRTDESYYWNSARSAFSASRACARKYAEFISETEGLTIDNPNWAKRREESREEEINRHINQICEYIGQFNYNFSCMA